MGPLSHQRPLSSRTPRDPTRIRFGAGILAQEKGYMRYECLVLEQRTGKSLKLVRVRRGDTQADPNVEGGIEKAVSCHGRILISIYVFDPRSLHWRPGLSKTQKL